MLSVSEVRSLILQKVRPLVPVDAVLSPSLLYHTLAESITSDVDSPPYDKALMDGYALRFVDADQELTVIEEVAAGHIPQKSVQAGQATRIMTGAPMPAGADTVIPIEKIEGRTSTIRLKEKPTKSGEHVLPRGREMLRGETILQSGTLLRPQVFGLLNTIGRTHVKVHPTPKVSILPTGDELVEPSEQPGPGQIRNSNGTMLMTQTTRAGGQPFYLGIARDHKQSMRSMIEKGLAEQDILLLSGGVSAGKYDLVPEVLQELGVTIHFHKVQMKPGKPLLFGTLEHKLVFGLPGNPVSSFVCFELFIRSALQVLRGQTDAELNIQQLPLIADFDTNNDRPTYLPAKIQIQEQRPCVAALAWFGSADLRSLIEVNALIVVPPGVFSFRTGDTVSVLPLEQGT